MSEKLSGQTQPVRFGERLASSQAFAELFRDGMALVEETATYLDGPGRQQSKKLERSAALAYATESMRLTTRLMQLASWLLLHRAVKEGEMSLAQASKEKSKVKLAATDTSRSEQYRIVAAGACAISSSDRRSFTQKCDGSTRRSTTRVPAERPATANPVERQLGLLKAAFGTESV